MPEEPKKEVVVTGTTAPGTGTDPANEPEAATSYTEQEMKVLLTRAEAAEGNTITLVSGWAKACVHRDA